MKQRFFKIKDENLNILHIESVRTGFYQISAVLLFSFLFVKFVEVLSCLKNSSSIHFFYGNLIFDFFFLFVGILLPLFLIVFAQRLPPAPSLHFNKISQTVTWQSGPNKLEISYDKIAFEKKMFLVKTGTASHSVMIRAISTTPFSTVDKPEEHARQGYIKDLCMYNAGTSEEADESIVLDLNYLTAQSQVI